MKDYYREYMDTLAQVIASGETNVRNMHRHRGYGYAEGRFDCEHKVWNSANFGDYYADRCAQGWVSLKQAWTDWLAKWERVESFAQTQQDWGNDWQDRGEDE